jgi:hypothetical protein
MVHAVQVRPIRKDEGNRLLRIVHRGSGSVVTWRRARIVLLSAQHMPVTKIAEVTFTSPDRVRDVLHKLQSRRVRLPCRRRLMASDRLVSVVFRAQTTCVAGRRQRGCRWDDWRFR